MEIPKFSKFIMVQSPKWDVRTPNGPLNPINTLLHFVHALEMGIDIGNVCRIGQIGAPWSVNSLAQRLGRSGRKEGDPSILIMFISQSLRGEKIVDRYIQNFVSRGDVRTHV